MISTSERANSRASALLRASGNFVCVGAIHLLRTLHRIHVGRLAYPFSTIHAEPVSKKRDPNLEELHQSAPAILRQSAHREKVDSQVPHAVLRGIAMQIRR